MEILELKKGFAKVEFTSYEIQQEGSVFNAIARRLDDGVRIKIIKPIDYDKKRDIFIVAMELKRGVVAQR